MDDNFKAILDNLPKRRQRSKLEPYTELIDQLRLRGHTYREIARILEEKCDLLVASSTIVRFVVACSKTQRKGMKHHEIRKTRATVVGIMDANVTPVAQGDDVLKRIEALKQRPAKNMQPPKQFEYDPDQPLHLPGKK